METALYRSLEDVQVVQRVVAGEPELFELVVRRHDQRLFRVARSILRDEAEAEDAVQLAYLTAFQRLKTFAGRSALSTWLTSIVIRCALARLRDHARQGRLVERAGRRAAHPGEAPEVEGPEQLASSLELQCLLEREIDRLPQAYRTVVVLRLVEGLSTAATAAALGLSEETVRVRLHRARGSLRGSLEHRLGVDLAGLYPFLGERCDRITAAVMIRLGPGGRAACVP